MRRFKIYQTTAKHIKCSCCNTKLTEAFKEINNSRAFYKLNEKEYLCKKNSCLNNHLSAHYEEFENEKENSNAYRKENFEIQRLEKELGIKR